MKVCDKCKSKLIGKIYKLKFETKEFEICKNCASQVVYFLEKPSTFGERVQKTFGGNI